MTYMITAFFTALLQKIRHVKTWLPMLMLPLAVFACLTFLPQEERTAPVQVGVSYPEDGGDALRSALEARSGTVVTFLAAEEDTVRGKVATGQWDCGLILHKDFDARLEELDLTGLITVCIGEGSTVYPLVRETIQAVIGENVPLFDGGVGTAKETRRRLEEAGLLNDTDRTGAVTFENSADSPALLALCRDLLFGEVAQ